MAMSTDTKLSIQQGELEFTFHKNGDLYEATGGSTMINQLLSNPIDGSLGNLYARLHTAEGIQAYPLLGIHSGSRFRQAGDRLVWEGEIAPGEVKKPIGYRVVFTLTAQGVWFWDVQLEGSGVTADIVYGQDVGLADPGAVRSNEAYLSQYIDHTVFEDANKGFVVCSRQNQPQGGKFPYLQQGSLTKAEGYSTDGFQFFGLSYKESNRPEALSKDKLANEVYQYEFAYTALQSRKTELSGDARFVFYGLFLGDHPSAITELEYADVIRQAWEEVESASADLEQGSDRDENGTAVTLSPQLGEPLQTLPVTMEELDQWFPRRQQVEYDGEQLLSFFTDSYEHIVLKEKELLVERPHGHILMSGDNVRFGAEVITTTSYMYGIFNSQLVVGNTNLNKMMSNARNALNVPKTSGQRIYVELDGKYRLLTLPSLFEIGFNYVRWYYKMPADTLIVTNFTTVDTPEVRLQVRSANGVKYRFLVTNQITMNVAEYEIPYVMEQDGEGGALTFRADASCISAQVYPRLTYRMVLDGATYSLRDESVLAEGAAPGCASLVAMELDASAEWTLTHQGLLNGGELPVEHRSAEAEIERYREFYAKVMSGFKLTKDSGDEGEFFKVNALAWWYTHNMLVHYSVPHGLEQYGGAAWGTRDVCQGPVEYFSATHQYEQVRDILLTVYAHQYAEDGNWPQWFMFDKYTQIQQEESHGDIIVWPLKVLGDYLTATRDFSILDEQIPYTSKHGFNFTEETASVREHVLKELSYIKEHFLHDTYLSSYGDGDWDDTLQPANTQLKQFMVSSWTVALTYQAADVLSKALSQVDPAWSNDLKQIAEGIKRDYNHYMLEKGVIPGFLYFEDPNDVKLMLHPEDRETGIKYRLLPMIQSMISELLSPEQAESHYQLIQDKLLFPDGVRLMDRPAQYVGGVNVHFKRAEQAANFGREIGLQYVHAHIRYIEAMAKTGRREQIWHDLAAINPIGIRDVVPNAELRQSNTYFSSSDGKFNTRYEAQQRFEDLRDGSAQVKGGWRIYSSGPGIYMNQLISNVLGIRVDGGDLLIDPVLPDELDGTRFEFDFAGPVTFIYRVKGSVVESVTINGHKVEAERISNPYRTGGLRISRAEFDKLRENGKAIVEIEM
ncbi:cellobiose phosphorylase [Paenibacillus sp. Marseille-P2973]|uniref:GH36-type glycosyl hydrolase domain-containing protein n=1 Tax=Paenibacillus sp. Marseille-P2973 TaxID=1871032 RepID=UPI001B377EC0|nr:cellobiose phosphorylase [Paenibacillus sp. Marseille-P2973]MBQ4899883.1 cellobiose phosphorylase [Paenibacillus sp. Marseille-P2973]